MSTHKYENALIGRRIHVVGPGHYRGRCIGQAGVIASVYDNSVGVLLDNMKNGRSGYGYFYFRLEDLEFIDDQPTQCNENEGEKDMQKLTGFVNVADVQFLKDDVAFRTFEYANYDPDLKAGDVCVVMSAHHGMGLAEVVDIKETPSGDLFREIVCKVDTSAYDNRVEMRRKTAELKEKMQERAKQLQDIALYQMLAKEDPAMQELLEQFKALQSL